MFLEIRDDLSSEFTPREVVELIHETRPVVKTSTIRTHMIGCTPNHPSHTHFSLPHNIFFYLQRGKFRLWRADSMGENAKVSVVRLSSRKKSAVLLMSGRAIRLKPFPDQFPASSASGPKKSNDRWGGPKRIDEIRCGLAMLKNTATLYNSSPHLPG